MIIETIDYFFAQNTQPFQDFIKNDVITTRQFLMLMKQETICYSVTFMYLCFVNNLTNIL